MRTLLTAIVTTGLFLCSPIPASGQESQCAPLPGLIDYLKSKYGEGILFQAMMSVEGKPDVPVILFAAKVGRTWTMIFTPKPGIGCTMRMSGDSFDYPDRELLDRDKPF